MRKDIVTIANRLIPKPKSIDKIQEQFVTDDIIKQVLLQFERCKDQLTLFAPYLKANSVEQTCYNIWAFLRNNITYQADNAAGGYQLVKSPAAVWDDKFCDCKSFSVATMCCLHILDIKGVFRFVSFNVIHKDIPTHVYVAAQHNGKEYIIDCCLPKFNMEKPYAKKYDYLPRGLYAVTGVDQVGLPFKNLLKGKFGKGIKKTFGKVKQFANNKAGCTCHPQFGLKLKRGTLNLSGIEHMTDAELGLLIEEQRLELEQEQAAKIHGIGSVLDNAYELELAAINNAFVELAGTKTQRKKLRIVPGSSSVPPVHRIEGNKKKVKKVAKKTKKALAKNAKGKGLNKKQAKLVEKAGQVVKKKKEGFLKKVGKGIVKAITAPLRLIAKGALEVTLPKQAMFFLYLFITDKNIIDRLPKAVVIKRDRQRQVADSIIKKLGMKEAHFMGILRNGIMKNQGQTPEALLKDWMQQAGFIGIVEEAFGLLTGLLQKIGAGKIEQLQQFAPDPSDFENIDSSSKQQMGNQIIQQETNNDVTTGRGTVPNKTLDEMNDAFNKSESNNVYSNSNYNMRDLGPAFKNTDEALPGESTDDEGNPVENKYGTDGKELDDVVVTNKPKESNTGLFIGLGLLAAVLMSKSN